MFVICVVVTVVLAVMLLASAGAKLTKADQVVTGLGSIGVPLTWFPRLAGVEIAGAAGLLIGLGVPALGVAAAIGVICYFVAALAFHFKAGDRNVAPPFAFLVLAVVALVLRLTTM